MKTLKTIKRVTIWEFKSENDYQKALNRFFGGDRQIKRQFNKNKTISGLDEINKKTKTERSEIFFLKD